MSKGLKNLQSSARAAARRERLEAGQPLQPGYDDDSGISGIGLTSVDELDPSYSSPETASSGSHSSFIGGGMVEDDDIAASAAASFATSHSFGMQTLQHQPQQQHQQHQQHRHQHQGHFYAPTGAHHGYTSSVSSTGSSGPIVLAASGGRHGNSPSSPGPSYRRSNAQRLSGAEKAVDVSVKRSRGGRPPQM